MIHGSHINIFLIMVERYRQQHLTFNVRQEIRITGRSPQSDYVTHWYIKIQFMELKRKKK